MKSIYLFKIISLSTFLVLFSACKNEEIQQDEPLLFEVSHTKNAISKEVAYVVKVLIDSKVSLTNNELHFSSGDGSDITVHQPSGEEEAEGKVVLTYTISYTYSAPGSYMVMCWLDQFQEEMFEKEITLDPS